MMITSNIRRSTKGVNAKMIWERSGSNRGGKAICMGFLPKALEENEFVPAPDAEAIGRGHEALQEALNKIRRRNLSSLYSLTSRL